MNSEFKDPSAKSKCLWSLNRDKEIKDPHDHDILRQRPKILANILEQIGNTPLVRLNKIPKQMGIKCEVLAKCEYFNAGGSVKDRIALKMVTDAERKGILKPGFTIIAATSGNTGIGVALAAAVKGYKCIIVLPEKMSNEKVNVLHGLGAKTVRTPTSAGFDSPDNNLRVAHKLYQQTKNSILLDQFRDAANPLVHYDQTAQEILDQTQHKVDMIVAGAGTGGTITGIGRRFKESIPLCKVVGVDPYGSILAEPQELNKSDTTFYEVEGIGYDFIPTVFDRSVVDFWVKTDDKSSLEMSRRLIAEEGLLCGGSSGAAVVAALKAAKDLREDQRCVVILPDGVRNYMTKFLDDNWMIERNFTVVEDNSTPKPWFWNQSILSLIDNMKILSVGPNTKCFDAISLMKSHAINQIPVVNGPKILGMITVGHILSKMSSNGLTMESPVTDVLIENFPKLTKNTNFYRICRILKSNPFVVIMDSISNTDQRIIGIITSMDILNHLAKQKSH